MKLHRLEREQLVKRPDRFSRHLHAFVPIGRSTRIRDRVDYALPFGRVGDVLGLPLVHRDLARISEHRRAAVARLRA